jgi:hypothetical protein
MQKHRSEVAALREEITAQYVAANLGLQGLNAGTSRHDFITARQERVATLHEELRGFVGDEAMSIVVEAGNSVPNMPTRSHILLMLKHELGTSEEAELFCDYLQDAWGILDTIANRFGIEQARKMLLAPAPPLVGEIPPTSSAWNETFKQGNKA